jgi:hypothetical protein
MPTIAYYLSTTDHPVDENHSLWHRPLPDNRLDRPSSTKKVGTDVITYGRYFSAVRQFCAESGWDRLVRAAACKLAQPVVKRDLAHLSVFLEKHGAFYHPARLHVLVNGQVLSFVVNVAASTGGRQVLSREVKALKWLNAQRPFGWFPQVYDYATDGLPMFMGDWFEGFHEFHLTRQTDDHEPAMMVWDGAADRCLLSDQQATAVYRQAAMILTACYDPISTCQIFPWHHAAGDFVVRLQDDRVTVKLITVRDYRPMVSDSAEADKEQTLLDTLLVFFIHLSLRMRLDRLDGVSAVTWAPDSCLMPIIEGFFQGLDLASRMSGLPEAFPEAFRNYFNRHDMMVLLPMADQITEAIFNEDCEEHRIIDDNLPGHISEICRVLSAG